MNAPRHKLNFAAIVLCTLALVGFAADSPSDPKFAKFKTKMLPQVGRKITAVGTLDAGKHGWWLSIDDSVVYIKATTTDRSDLAKLNALGQFRLHKVKAVGTLKHQDEWRSTNRWVSGIPDHFFFDAAEVAVTNFEAVQPELPRGK